MLSKVRRYLPPSDKHRHDRTDANDLRHVDDHGIDGAVRGRLLERTDARPSSNHGNTSLNRAAVPKKEIPNTRDQGDGQDQFDGQPGDAPDDVDQAGRRLCFAGKSGRELWTIYS